MNEKMIERKLVEKARKSGGLALKFVSPGFDGVPDRIVFYPGGRVAFVELKSPGHAMRSLQIRRQRHLESLGFRVYRIDDAEKIDGVLDEIRGA